MLVNAKIEQIRLSIEELEPKIKRYKKLFSLSKNSLLGLPLILLAFQLYFTHESLDLDFRKLSHWVDLPKYLVLPIGSFSFVAALTGIYGLYLRSLQLDMQLLKASEQIQLTQLQFKHARKKDDFALLVEHRNEFYETFMSVFHMKDMEKDFRINKYVLYKYLFLDKTTDCEQLDLAELPTKALESLYILNNYLKLCVECRAEKLIDNYDFKLWDFYINNCVSATRLALRDFGVEYLFLSGKKQKRSDLSECKEAEIKVLNFLSNFTNALTSVIDISILKAESQALITEIHRKLYMLQTDNFAPYFVEKDEKGGFS